jgi:subtilisin-like proprotein convertase family protein
MIKKLLLLTIFLGIFSQGSFAQRILWQESNKEQFSLLQLKERASTIQDYKVYRLDFEGIKDVLTQAPLRGHSVSDVIVYFPNLSGEMEPYRVYEAPVLDAALGSQFPEIKSYVGQGVTQGSSVIRFSTTIFGFHAMIMSPQGTVMIDPYTNDLNYYAVYAKNKAQTDRIFECLVEDVEKEVVQEVHFSPRNAFSIEANTGIFRTYRLALASTEEYSQYHINQAGVAGGTLSQRQGAVLAAMNVTMTRVNGIYERDMSLTMVIVPNNTNIIFLLPENPDNLTNNSGGTLINEIQPVIDSNIGFFNYDIGHVFSTGGGGVAQLNSPCTSGKARGVTGLPAPVGDPFDVDFVSHEMGHQYGATHTQNNSCARTLATAVEPGSASTIMGYAGICAPNVQFNSDAYFHAVSMAQMDNFVAGTGNCSNNVSNNNTPPVINPIANYVIPRSTPFVLPGNATDANNDILTYCWEQTNNQASTQPPQATSTVGPNFRSLFPSASPNRFMPNMNTVLAGQTANTWEVVPSVGRTMNFALTVRDNRTPLGGQTARANMQVTTVDAAGPFVVTSPNTPVTWTAGTNQTVTWDVAGTTANGVNTPFVDIYLSTNGGGSFPILLASQVPNDGSEVVTVPNITGTQNRIMVMGHGNIFFDVSNTNFSITAAPSSMAISFNGVEGEQNKTICKGEITSYTINYTTLAGFNANTNFAVSGQPAGLNVTFSPASLSASGTVTMNISNTANAAAGFYTLQVTATSGSQTSTANFYLNLAGDFTPVILNSPANGATGVNPESVTFTWEVNALATSYIFELASDAGFNTILLTETVSTNSISVPSLSSSTTLFWRVKPVNGPCVGDFSAAFSFNTTFCGNYPSSNVPVTIPTVVATVQSTLVIPSSESVTIESISVNLNMSHTWINDVIVTLVSPSGTQVRLLNRPCPSSGQYRNAVATFISSGLPLSCNLQPQNAVSGNVQPFDSFAPLLGQNSAGTWTLRVQDVVNQDGGAINAWSLNFCSQTPPLDVVSHDVSSFAIYPNPSKGNFTIKLPEGFGDTMDVNVYDIRGRKVFHKTYSTASGLEQQVALQGAQAGVYLVEVSDGSSKATKRLIIE